MEEKTNEYNIQHFEKSKKIWIIVKLPNWKTRTIDAEKKPAVKLYTDLDYKIFQITSKLKKKFVLSSLMSLLTAFGEHSWLLTHPSTGW